VRVLDQGALPEGGAYIAFELLRGETLGERLRRVATLPAPEVVALGLAAADALWAVHRAGVVHRDVKPDNLFLHRDGQGEVLKLLDFGVAYVTWAETRLTRDGASVGTRGYAPPEQELGREVDARADVYALGVTLTEVLTGARPPAGAATTLSEEPPLAHSATARIDRGCEGPLRALLERMTAEDPAERPADMLAVREALEAARALGERPSGGPSRAQGSR
jgi:serine/threonine protein kinase